MGDRMREPHRAHLHMLTFSTTQPTRDAPWKTQKIDPEDENLVSRKAGARGTVQNSPFGGVLGGRESGESGERYLEM